MKSLQEVLTGYSAIVRRNEKGEFEKLFQTIGGSMWCKRIEVASLIPLRSLSFSSTEIETIIQNKVEQGKYWTPVLIQETKDDKGNLLSYSISVALSNHIQIYSKEDIRE